MAEANAASEDKVGAVRPEMLEHTLHALQVAA
jgi:hypothetical protein